MLVINICVGTACHLQGAYHIIDSLQTIIRDRKISGVTIKGVFCLGKCTQKAIAVKLNDEPQIYLVNDDNLDDFFEQEVMPRLK